MKKFSLETERLVLRPLKLSDLDAIYQNANDKFQTRFLKSIEPPVSRKQEANWIRSTWKQWKNETGFTFAAVRKDSNEMIGALDLLEVSKTHRRAKIGIFFYQKHWGHGFGTEAVKRLLGFGFKTLKLNRIEYGFMEENTRSAGVMKKLGFKIEGIQREFLRKRGKFVNHVFGSILASEWKKRKKV